MMLTTALLFSKWSGNGLKVLSAQFQRQERWGNGGHNVGEGGGLLMPLLVNSDQRMEGQFVCVTLCNKSWTVLWAEVWAG